MVQRITVYKYKCVECGNMYYSISPCPNGCTRGFKKVETVFLTEDKDKNELKTESKKFIL